MHLRTLVALSAAACGRVEKPHETVPPTSTPTQSPTDSPTPTTVGPPPSTTDTGTPPAPFPTDCDPDDPALSPTELQILALTADSWLALPGTRFHDACAPVQAANPGIALNQGCDAIVNAWGGATWDPASRQLLVWGGGHADYGGNEVYALSPHAGAWSALTTPSASPIDGSDPLADGTPASRHTYEQLAWVDSVGRMFAWGGSRAPSGYSTDTTWLFDPVSGTWTLRAEDLISESVGNFSSATAYDAVTDRVLVRTYTYLQAYDVAADEWELLGDFGFAPYWPALNTYGSKSGALDPTRRLFFSFGGGDYLVYDLDAEAIVYDQWATTGGSPFDNGMADAGHPEQAFESGGAEILTATAPGLDYDPATDALVAWTGGGPWVLDLSTKSWSRASGVGAPAAPVATGTYGRWAYMSYLNAFVLLNEPGQDVYVYKHTAGCG